VESVVTVGFRGNRKRKSRSRWRHLVDRHRDGTDRKRGNVIVDVIDDVIDDDSDANETQVAYRCDSHVLYRCDGDVQLSATDFCRPAEALAIQHLPPATFSFITVIYLYKERWANEER